jgi:acyl-coenzyme A thioesterase PaaI-like protein
LELKIIFIHALTTTGPVRALGKVIHSKNTAIAERRIEDPDGKLYALCTMTCLLFPMNANTVAAAR